MLSLKHFRLSLIAVFTSALFSVCAFNTHNPIVVDGILYLHVAQVFLQKGYHAAMAVYPWPFFSIAIAAFSQVTHLSLEHSADAINLIFQASIVVSFIYLVQLLGGGRVQQIFAAITILVYPYLNATRAYITRDFGYWAFALIALVCLIHYARKKEWRYALGFSMMMGFSSLFRIEGVALLCFAPLGLFFTGMKEGARAKLFEVLKAYAVLLAIGATLLIYAVMHPELWSQRLGRLTEFFDALRHGFPLLLQNMNTHALMLLVIAVIKVMSVPYIIFSIFALWKKLMPADRPAKSIIFTFMFINGAALLFFLSRQFFVDSRYVVLLCLLLLLWVPFGVSHLFLHWRDRRWLLPVTVVMIVGMAASGLIHLGYSKAYITDAGLWIKQNTPADIKLYSNSAEVLYYADRIASNWQNPVNQSPSLADIYQHHWHRYDYLAVRINEKNSRDRAKVLQELNAQPIKTFQNHRGDEVMIFKVS